MGKPQLVVFDCDGVMFDSRRANEVYYNQLLAHFGRPPMSREELDFVHIHHVGAAVAHIFRHYPGEAAAADQHRRTLDYRPFLAELVMAPDLPAFLAAIRPPARTAISTNRTSTMAAILEEFGLAGSFDLVVTAQDVARPKPHPEALERILAHFDLRSEQGLFIGDSIIDQEHAAAAGMPLVAYRNPALQADFHVSSFMEILGLPVFG
ncbi:MAG: HAD family hydrolase [Thermodesulfobacteriota bacterium]